MTHYNLEKTMRFYLPVNFHLFHVSSVLRVVWYVWSQLQFHWLRWGYNDSNCIVTMLLLILPKIMTWRRKWPMCRWRWQWQR